MSDYAQESWAVKVPVKLTVFVEEGVAPLVLALSEMDVVILDSSQGAPERPAHVRFRRRDGEAAELAREIAELLSPRNGNLGCELRTIASVGAGDGGPVVELACQARQVIPLALALRAARGRRAASTISAARTGDMGPRAAFSRRVAPSDFRRLRAVR